MKPARITFGKIKKAFRQQRKSLSKIYEAARFVGFDPRAAGQNLRWFPHFMRSRNDFIRLGGRITHWYPILTDWSDQAGTARGHYFHQDLLVASFIHGRNPKRHIDIGSRVDGFVTHVASFRRIEVVDVRPLADTGHSSISFLQADLMKELDKTVTADSISCLHAIEHFGLGRYGEPIDPEGHKKGFLNLLKMLAPKGTLYISFPIANQNEVHFNAHRVFHPLDILSWPGSDQLKLVRFDYVDDAGALHQKKDIRGHAIKVRHGCGIYTFTKKAITKSGTRNHSL